MDKLRIPFFVGAGLLLLMLVLLECGSGYIIKPLQADMSGQLQELAKKYEVDPKDQEQEFGRLAAETKPPGLAIPQMALLDGLMLFTVGLMGARFLFSDRVSGRLQGILSLIVSILVILAGIMKIFADLGQLLIMVSLFLSPPFRS